MLRGKNARVTTDGADALTGIKKESQDKVTAIAKFIHWITHGQPNAASK